MSNSKSQILTLFCTRSELPALSVYDMAVYRFPTANQSFQLLFEQGPIRRGQLANYLLSSVGESNQDRLMTSNAFFQLLKMHTGQRKRQKEKKKGGKGLQSNSVI